MSSLRYGLLAMLALPFRAVQWGFPGWKMAHDIVEKLSFVRSRYGVLLLNSPGDRTFGLCVRGYGNFISDAIANQTNEFVFLDIGANLGVFSLLAARHRKCRRVLAIEPAPQTFRKLVANIRRNDAAIVEPLMGAVTSSPNAFVFLSYSARHSGISRVTEPNATAIRVPSISAARLDDLMPQSTPAIVAKIDVEGSELEVLSILRQTHFRDKIVEMIIEVSVRNLGMERRDELLRQLKDAGYSEVSRAGAAEHYDAQYRRLATRQTHDALTSSQ